MTTYTQKPLSELVSTIIDYRGKTPKKLGGNWSSAGIRALSAKNIKDGKIVNVESIRYVDTALYERWMKEEVQVYDILMTSEAPLGETYLVKNKEKLLLSQRLFAIRTKKNMLNPTYLYYYLRSPSGRNELFSRITGSTVGGIRQAELLKIKISFPNLPTQQKIASILSTYDDLIEINEKRIKILEEMAERLYTEWFVQFRFPGYEKAKLVDSHTSFGMIPEGWEVKQVGNIIRRVSSGKKYDTKSVFSKGKVPVLDQGKSGIIGYHNDQAGVSCNEDSPVIVFANHTCYQQLISYPFSAIQNVLPYVPQGELDIYWLRWATKDLIKFHDYKGHWPEFIAKDILVPKTEITNQFGMFVGEIVKSINKLKNVNNNLTKTRDLLIPQFISGKKEVK